MVSALTPNSGGQAPASQHKCLHGVGGGGEQLKSNIKVFREKFQERGGIFGSQNRSQSSP